MKEVDGKFVEWSDETDEEVDDYHEKMIEVHKKRQKSVPKPTCCKEAKYIIYLSYDYENESKKIAWFIQTPDHIRRLYNYRKTPFSVKVTVCPCCGEKLPEVKLRKKFPKPMGHEDDEYYCSSCNEKHSCYCYPPLAKYKIVKEKSKKSV